MRMWRNGEKAEVVQKIIEYDFQLLKRHLSNNILALPTTERKTLSSDYLCEGLIVYDTTLNKWFIYKNNNWQEYNINNKIYVQNFTINNWSGNKISIPYSTHLISSPVVGLYMLSNNTYLPVIGGVSIDENYNVILTTDLTFDGRVIIK